MEAKLRAKAENLQAQIDQRDASTQKPVLQRKVDGLKSEIDKLKKENIKLRAAVTVNDLEA